MSQSKKGSAVETATNFIAGATLSIVSYWFLLPLWGIHIPLAANLFLTTYFALLSVVKTYIIRRLFNRAIVRRKVSGLPAHVGSIQSLSRGRSMSGMSIDDYKDVADGYQDQSGQRPVRSGRQKHDATGVKEDKELRK